MKFRIVAKSDAKIWISIIHPLHVKSGMLYEYSAKTGLQYSTIVHMQRGGPIHMLLGIQ